MATGNATLEESSPSQDVLSDANKLAHPSRRPSRVPNALKIAYASFCAVLVFHYLRSYGPTNFLYFCDQALLLTLAGVWLESGLLVSMAAVGIVAPQLVWVADLLAKASGHPLTGMTDYMFDPSIPLVLRALSAFHGWLPFLLLYLVYRLGDDRRALPIWSAWAAMTILACFFLMPPPRPAAGLVPVNINYVWGMSTEVAQSWMPAWAWLIALLVGLPTLLFLPTHLVLRRFMPQAAATSLRGRLTDRTSRSPAHGPTAGSSRELP